MRSLMNEEKPTRKAILESGELLLEGYVMPFTAIYHGSRPENGYSLFIGLHGGGGCPKQTNDGQYENHKGLYTLPEGIIWFVPRAPEDAWNMWHLPYIDRMLDYIIQSFIICDIANPNKVFVTGYSAGGDGVYKLAPRMADRLAGAAACGGHPNGASILSLRNTAFTLHVGEHDSAYNRNKVGLEYQEKFRVEKEKDPSGYDHFVKIQKGCGHWMDLRDFEGFKWLFTKVRTPLPHKIVWKQCNDVLKLSFYWLVLPEHQIKKGSLVTALLKGNSVFLESTDVTTIGVRLNDSMVNLQCPVLIYFNQICVFNSLVERSLETARATILERYDPNNVFCAEIYVNAP